MDINLGACKNGSLIQFHLAWSNRMLITCIEIPIKLSYAGANLATEKYSLVKYL